MTLAGFPTWVEAEANLLPGDVVLVTKENMKRGNWPLARVVEPTNPRRLRSDDLVRSVEVRFADGRQLRRPIKHLIHLETDTPESVRLLRRRERYLQEARFRRLEKEAALASEKRERDKKEEEKAIIEEVEAELDAEGFDQGNESQ